LEIYSELGSTGHSFDGIVRESCDGDCSKDIRSHCNDITLRDKNECTFC